MKNALTILFCIGMIYSAQSQIADYDISTFVRPELLRTTSGVRFSLNLENENNNINLTDNTEYGIRLDGYYSNTKFINNEKHQSFISNFANLIGSSNSGFKTSEQDFLSLTLGRYYSDKKFRTDNKFHEFGYNFRAQGAVYNKPLENEQDLELSISVPVYLGKGRIEIVNDAWEALRILESLQESGFLMKSMSTEDIEQFALEIGNIKNSRMTDPRLESIYEYELLSKYLVEQEIINPENYAVFATLNDAWRFENFFTIRSGKSYKYGLRPTINYSNNSSIDNRQFSFYELAAKIEREVYKPIKKNVQLNYSYGLDVAARRFNSFNENFSSFDDYYIRPYINASTSYYPNARTNYTLGIRSSYLHSINTNNLLLDSNIFSTVLSGRYMFYASPQLTFELTGNLNLNSVSNPFQNALINTNEITFRTNYRFF